ncbi:hypothetical protein GCM10027418_19170 [Mariniluteicoccus endophyticus]
MHTFRNCPRCNTPAANVYAYKYQRSDGTTGTTRQAYCPTCRKTYGPGRDRTTPRPEVHPAPRPLTIPEHTLDDVLANPGPWLTCHGTRRWRTLRRLILDRDNHACQLNGDGCTGTATVVHHITPADDGGNDHPDNLRSVCAHCNGAAQRPVCLDCGSSNVGSRRT